MTRALFAPGIDRESATGATPGSYQPSRGAGGVFAKILQGSTPKYAYNDETNAGRPDLFRNTMARMFVRIDPNEMGLFLSSVTDAHTKNSLVRRLVGDPTSDLEPTPTATGVPSATGATSATSESRRRSSSATNGYLDFFIQTVQMSFQEKIQVSETLSDNYVAYAFGQAPPVWNFSGSLINSVQDDQASNFFRLYTHILRATQMARRQKSLSLAFDSYVVNGVMMNLNLALSSSNELLVPFSFQLLVKRVFITNYTKGWVPTTAGTPFPADPLARDFDRLPREEGQLRASRAVLPSNVSEIAPVSGLQTNPNAPLNPGPAPAPSTPAEIAANLEAERAFQARAAEERAQDAVRPQVDALRDAVNRAPISEEQRRLETATASSEAAYNAAHQTAEAARIELERIESVPTPTILGLPLRRDADYDNSLREAQANAARTSENAVAAQNALNTQRALLQNEQNARYQRAAATVPPAPPPGSTP